MFARKAARPSNAAFAPARAPDQGPRGPFAPPPLALSRIPALPPTGALELANERVDEAEAPAPVLHAADAGLDDAGVADAAPADKAPPVDPPATPPVAPPAPCALTTLTLANAPDGTPDNRATVGVNEQVEIVSPVAANWAASAGRIKPARTIAAIWIAPAIGGPCTITATPATGAPCSVAMTAITPDSNMLARIPAEDRVYADSRAGSGFVATLTVLPLNVSFSRIEIREGGARAAATGYYRDTRHWNGKRHSPAPGWARVDSANSGLKDAIGDPPPGTSGPFSAGAFLWQIPQFYRPRGGRGAGTQYSLADQSQIMADATGAETTSKEGADRSRTPIAPPPRASRGGRP
jgi:hypothetical protein